MTTKVFTNFRAPVNSYPLGEMNLGLMRPGRYSGFDVMTGASLSIKIGHSGIIKKSSPSVSGTISETIFGALFMPNGCTIQNETEPGEGVDFIIDNNTGNANPRHDLLVCEHEYVQVEGGIVPVYLVQKGANDGSTPALAIPKKQVIIGIITIAPNGNSFGALTYVKSPVPIPGDNTNQEFITNIGIPALLANMGIQDVITNDPLISENSTIGVADDKVLQITKPASGSNNARFYGVWKFEHFATQAAGTVKAWLGITSVDNGFSLLKFLVGSTIFEDTANDKGIEYAQDYSGNYTERSLVDREYVDSKLTGVTQTKVIKLTGWTLDEYSSISTGLPSGSVIISATPYLECTTNFSGFVIGDIATVNSPELPDAGGHDGQGIGCQWREDTSGTIHVLANSMVSILGPWTTDGSATSELNVLNTANWAIRIVLLYK